MERVVTQKSARTFATMARAVCLVAVVAVPLRPAFAAGPGGLGGSPASMRLQHTVAEESDFTFVKTPVELRVYVENEILEPVDSSEDFLLRDVSFPYARPEVHAFIARLAAEYHDAFRETLVVTSLTRPLSTQPANAHKLSVHPTGMAVDFRVPGTAEERSWLERSLLALEKQGVLDVTREKRPPHYHVAVFPTKYAAYAATLPPLPRRVVPAPVVVAEASSAAKRSAIDGIPAMPIAALLGLTLSATLGFVSTRRLTRVTK